MQNKIKLGFGLACFVAVGVVGYFAYGWDTLLFYGLGVGVGLALGKWGKL